ncbi:CPBP family intramembrane glutamic endopeptidase [uncultured Aquimarina sp.]|uniref:CPBP family intramembrane glutamic endopeptidase n=1 Tax=uncultured Aquimarina sp. TaxID=575652 RepID=UPI002629E489|nr:CPBP family intramembrane glutamic endopeptidase [uncultured Aquimarina sp.]
MYIEQGRKGKLGMWKYLPIPIAFLGLMGLNFWLASIMDLDMNAFMEKQILAKGKNRFFAENLIVFAVFLGALFFWVKYVHQQSIRSLTTSRKKIDWKRVFFMFGLMALYILITTGITYFMVPEDYEINFNAEPFFILATIAIILVPIQTSFEEYLFRGYLMQGLGLATKTRWIPLLLTSVIFGLMHSANPEVEMIGPIIMVYYIGTGFFLGIITLMDEGLELALGFHAANNLVTALLVTSTWTAFQTDSLLLYTAEPEINFEIMIPVLVVFPIFLLILAKKYKWSGWKDKLFGKIEAEPLLEEK